MARPRLAITAVFFLNGAVFSSWYARLPEIQAELGLGTGELGLALGTPVAGLAGFAVMGIGLSVVFPLALRAAGEDGGGGTGLAAVSTVGYAGFLTGPPVIGLIASASDLGVALGLAAALCAVAALLAAQVAPARLATPSDRP